MGAPWRLQKESANEEQREGSSAKKEQREADTEMRGTAKPEEIRCMRLCRPVQGTKRVQMKQTRKQVTGEPAGFVSHMLIELFVRQFHCQISRYETNKNRQIESGISGND